MNILTFGQKMLVNKINTKNKKNEMNSHYLLSEYLSAYTHKLSLALNSQIINIRFPLSL